MDITSKNGPKSRCGLPELRTAFDGFWDETRENGGFRLIGALMSWRLQWCNVPRPYKRLEALEERKFGERILYNLALDTPTRPADESEMTESSLSADFVFTGHGATMNYFNNTTPRPWGRMEAKCQDQGAICGGYSYSVCVVIQFLNHNFIVRLCQSELPRRPPSAFPSCIMPVWALWLVWGDLWWCWASLMPCGAKWLVDTFIRPCLQSRNYLSWIVSNVRISALDSLLKDDSSPYFS